MFPAAESDVKIYDLMLVTKEGVEGFGNDRFDIFAFMQIPTVLQQ